MGNNTRKTILGVISLLASAILQAICLFYLQNDWIVFGFTCIYAVVFLKYLKDESVVNWLNSRLSKKALKLMGIFILFAGIAFIPQMIGQPLKVTAEIFAYIASYICWMIGLLLVDISGGQ